MMDQNYEGVSLKDVPFYKKKFDHGVDELDMIVMHYLQIFDESK